MGERIDAAALADLCEGLAVDHEMPVFGVIADKALSLGSERDEAEALLRKWATAPFNDPDPDTRWATQELLRAAGLLPKEETQ